MTGFRLFNLGLAKRVSSSSRVRYALTAAALSSVGGFAISISLAHRLSLQEFGDYAVSMAVVALVVGFAHAGLAEPMLSVPEPHLTLRIGIHRASTIGLIAVALVLPIALLIKAPFLVFSAVALHGLVLYDLVRTFNTAVGRPALGAWQEFSWLSVGAVSSLLTLFEIISPILGFAVYIVAGALIGYSVAFMAHTNPMPGWPSSPVGTGTSLAFGTDYLVGSGSSQVLTAALGAIGQVSVVGALRAAGTLMGPITLALGMSRTLLIPYLAKSKRAAKAQHDSAVQISILMGLLSLPLLVFIAFLPEQIGSLVLGQNWSSAQSLMPFLALEAFFIVITAAPFAGHRAHLAARRSLIVRLALSGLRLVFVFFAAIIFGAPAAAAAMALVALVGSIVWWSSYIRLRRAVERHEQISSV